jgi:hypothetical protein
VVQHKMQVSIDGIISHDLPVALSLHNPSVPLVKIHTIGGLRIEILQHSVSTLAQAQYAPAVSLSGRGVGPAQLLLKHLLSAPQHFCSVDWLNEYWYGTDEQPTRIDNRVSFLRGLLCPPYLQQGEQRDSCRKQLVSFVGGSQESGNGYRLGAYPLIWIDIDALDWNVQQACRMERYGDDALLFWERAYELASQGVYLPEEVYSDWTEPRRSAVMGALSQSVHALKRLYLIHFGKQGQAEIMRLLRNYLLQFPTDEDALRSLMELLGEQERFQEVQQVFTRTKRYVEEEGNTLDARTLDMWEYLRTKQIHRQRVNERSPLRDVPPLEHESVNPLFPLLSEAVTIGIVKAMEALEQKKREASGNSSDNL